MTFSSMTDDFISEPQWVITGGLRRDGMAMVIASSSLTRTVLSIERDFNRDFFQEEDPATLRCHLTVFMPTFTVVVAPSYEEALRDLFTRWSPAGTPRMALAPPSTKMIEG